MDRNANGALKGEVVQSFVLMGLMAAVFGLYAGIATLAARAFG